MDRQRCQVWPQTLRPPRLRSRGPSGCEGVSLLDSKCPETEVSCRPPWAPEGAGPRRRPHKGAPAQRGQSQTAPRKSPVSASTEVGMAAAGNRPGDRGDTGLGSPVPTDPDTGTSTSPCPRPGWVTKTLDALLRHRHTVAEHLGQTPVRVDRTLYPQTCQGSSLALPPPCTDSEKYKCLPESAGPAATHTDRRRAAVGPRAVGGWETQPRALGGGQGAGTCQR